MRRHLKLGGVEALSGDLAKPEPLGRGPHRREADNA